MSRRDARGPTGDLPLDLDLDDPPPSQSGSPTPARSVKPPPPRPIDPGATLPTEFADGLDDAVPFDLTPPPPKEATPPPQARQSAKLERPSSRNTGKGAPERPNLERPNDRPTPEKASPKGDRKSVNGMGEVPPASALRRPTQPSKAPGALGIVLIGLVVLGCAGGLGTLAVGGWYYTRPVPVPVEVVPPPAPPEPPAPTELDGIPVEHRLRADPNGAPPPPSRPQAP
jgi:hypothetical protein